MIAQNEKFKQELFSAIEVEICPFLGVFYMKGADYLTEKQYLGLDCDYACAG